MRVDPNLLRTLLKQVKMEDVPATEVIIKTDSGDLVITNPVVKRLRVKGSDVFQVSGEVVEQVEVSEEDVQLVMSKTGCSEEEAIEALGESEGDIAGAIMFLKNKK